MQAEPTKTVVYVRAGGPTYHVEVTCGAMQAEAGAGLLGTCRASQAYLSCLTACPECASELSGILKARLGAIPSGERKRRSYPRLQPVSSAAPSATPVEVTMTDFSEADLAPARAPYGSPASADDVRFDNATHMGWGAAAYGQNHDEFLGENTDDDNDWRGGARYLD